MKKKLLFLVPLISTSMVLTACGGLGGDGESGNGISLPNTAEQAVNMFYQFASNTGVEITYRVYDDESAQPETYTIGFKNDVFWVKESVAYKKVGTTLESYEYDASKRSYEFQAAVAESGQYSLDYFLKSLTSAFYAGYEYASGSVSAAITAKKDTTFLNRAATEYTFSASAGSATATLNIVFDNATGITLKIYGSATGGGDSSSAEYEVTSFAVGDAVTIPTLNKSSGQGGEGQGGEGDQTDVDVFSNKLLMYVSNESANLYANSQLGLFADGKFEFKFTQNGFVIVIFGSYTVAASKASATLVANKVYKDQDKQLSDMSGTYVLSYVSGSYSLAINNGKVNFNASGAQPTHYVVPGQGGGENDVENFVNHAFVYVSQQNAPNFVNSSIALFDDDTFEVVTTQNGSLVVYIGTYTVNSSDTAATLSVQKYYSASSGTYTNQAVGNWLLTLQQNNYMLSMAGGPTVYYSLSSEAPVHADIPADEGQGQTGDDAKYKVNEATWNEMIVNRGLISLSSNFTMVTSDASGQTKYEFDSGKVHYTFASSSFTNEMFYEFTSLSSGTFYYKNEGKWEKQDAPADMHLTFDDYIGVLPVPYSKVSFNSTSYYYGCNEWKDEQQDAYQNPRFYFEEGNLIKTTYKHWNVDYEYNFNAYGTTSVTLPEVSGGGQGGEGGQTDDNARYKITSTLWNEMIMDAGLISVKSNFTAMVRTSDNSSGANKYEFDNGKIHCAYADGAQQFEEFDASSRYTYYVDNGVWYKRQNSYGIWEYMNSLGLLGCEFDQLTFNKDTHEYELETLLDSYSGSVYASSIAISFVDNQLMKISYTRDGVYHETEFSKYGTTSVTLPEVGSSGQGGEGGEGGGGQQTTSKWPAEQIAALLSELELNVTLPAPKSDDSKIARVSVNATADNTALQIIIAFNSGDDAVTEWSSYIGFDNPDFSMTGYDEATYSFIYLNKAKDVQLTVAMSADFTSLIITVSKYEAPETSNYPAEDIAKYFEDSELENVLPSLEMDGVSYQFSEGTLIMSALKDNTTEDIVNGAKGLLLKAGFKTMYLDDDDSDEIAPSYVHPSFEYYVYFMVVDNYVYATIVPCIYLADYTFLSYPGELISNTRPEDFTDNLPSFDIGDCVYSFHEGFDGGYELRIHLQEGMDAERTMSMLTQRLARGFIVDDDGVYTSANGEIMITIQNIQDSMIKIVIDYLYEEEPPIEEPIEVSYSLVWDKGNWEDDITAADAKIYAYVWGGEEGDQWIELEPIFNEDGTISFNLDITSDYTGVKIVRFAPDSELGWEGDEGVKIWNQSGDYELNGKGGEIHFVVA